MASWSLRAPAAQKTLDLSYDVSIVCSASHFPETWQRFPTIRAIRLDVRVSFILFATYVVRASTRKGPTDSEVASRLIGWKNRYELRPRLAIIRPSHGQLVGISEPQRLKGHYVDLSYDLTIGTYVRSLFSFSCS